MRIVFSFLVVFFTNVVYAEDKAKVSSLENDAIGVTNYFQMFFGLFIVVALIFAVAWVMRRMGSVNSISSADLKVLGGVSVGQRERVVLLQAGDVQILVGVSPGAVRKIHVLEKPITSTSSISSKPSANFAEKLHAAIKSRSNA